MKTENFHSEGGNFTAKKLERRGSVVSHGYLRGTVAGVILVIVMVHIGFSKTYIQFFPKFDGFKASQHFHGIMMMSWLLMLLIQPILILNGKTKLHRQVGGLSYVLAPMILLSMFLVIQSRYYDYLEKVGQTKAVIAWLSINFRMMVFFAVVFFLAMYYKHKPALHMRFMCSTAFLLTSPWLVRFSIGYLGLSHADSHSLDRNFSVAITGVITIADSFKTRKISPFVLVFGFMILQKILWEMSETSFLQFIGGNIAKMF